MVQFIRAFITALFYYFSTGAYANLATERISIPEGLPDSVVFSLAQDNRYLWFGTTNGLSRYNGYEMKNFNNDPLSSNFLSNNSISHLQIDHQKRLWISTWVAALMSCHWMVNQLLLQQKESEANNIPAILCVTLEDSQGFIGLELQPQGLISTT